MTATDTTAGWQLDEAGAKAYERNLVPRFFEPFAADLLDGLDLQPGQHLIDVACGTGIVARRAAPRLAPSGQVTAVDISPAMLAVARQITSGTRAPISFEQADATKLPLPDGSTDVVVCQQGLQFFPDRPAALAEMFRVLAAGGQLAVSRKHAWWGVHWSGVAGCGSEGGMLRLDRKRLSASYLLLMVASCW